MDPVKELYWNVGRDAVIPMYIIILTTSILVTIGVVQRISGYRVGQKPYRSDRWITRSLLFVWNGLVQMRLMRNSNGIRHMLFFWSLLVLAAGSVLLFIHEWVAHFWEIPLLAGNRYRAFSFLMDVAGFTGLITLIGMMIKRCLIIRTERNGTLSDCLMYGILLSVFVSGFLLEGLRMAATTQAPLDSAFTAPIGFGIASGLSALSQQSTLKMHHVMWWAHLILVSSAFFIVPYSRLRHIFAGAANQFFMDLNPFGYIKTLDPCNGDLTHAGAATPQQFSWKDIMDSDACVECGECQKRCPVYLSGKPLSPMKLNTLIGTSAFQNPEENIIHKLSANTIWSCTTCRVCQYICPMQIKHPTKILEMRRHLVLKGHDFGSPDITQASNWISMKGHPFHQSKIDRTEWYSGLDVVLMHPKTGKPQSDYDILYFAGCFPSMTPKGVETARNFVKLCHAAGIRVGVLGRSEVCCGEPIRKLGNEMQYQQLAAKNIHAFKSSGAQHIVTTCPHCSNTLNKDYRDLWANTVKIEHYTLFIHQLLNEKRLTLHTKNSLTKATYHDSCCLGRCNNVFDEPRELLSAAGIDVQEMDANREVSTCCGGGGGRALASNETDQPSVHHVRMAQAVKTQMNTVIVNCPICLVEMDKATQNESFQQMKITDLSHVLLDSIAH